MKPARMLLERETELDLLAGLLADIGSSGGKVILVRGEAGIGKTTLVREFIDRSSEAAHVLVGSCDDLLTARPLGPFWDMARDESGLLDALKADDRTTVMGTVLDLTSRSLRSTIILVEDTQWADEATLDVFSFLGRRIGDTHGLLLLTYRDSDVDYDHPLRGVLGGFRAEDVVRIRLGGLSLVGVSSLIAESGFDAQEVFAATDGNPFLAIEMASSGDGAIPLSVEDSVLARVRRLSPTAGEMLKVLSVIPDPVSRSEVEALFEEAVGGLRDCEQRGLLDVDREWVVFHHDLIRRTVEASLTGVERVDANRLVLEALSPETDPARLVHHAREANDTSRLVELAPRAARAAVATGSYREAVAHFRLLTPHIDLLTDEDKGPILDDWAWAETLGSGYASAMAPSQMALDHYRETGDRKGEAKALAKRALFYEWLAQRVKAEQSVHDAIEVLGPNPDGADLATVLDASAYLAMMAGDAPATIELVDRAMEAAGPNMDERLFVRLLVHKGVALNITHFPAGREILETTWERAVAGGVWREAYRAMINNASQAVDNRDLAAAEEYAQRAVAVCTDHYQAGPLLYSNATYASVLELQGHWDQAEELARDQLAQTSGGMVQVVAFPVVGVIEARRGRTSAGETLRTAWELAVESAEFQRLAPAAAAMAEYAWISADSDVPLDEIRKVTETDPNTGWEWYVGSIAFWLWKLGELADIPAGIAEPYRLAIAGDARAAADIWLERGCPYERAIALTHGDSSAQLEALDILDGLGATAVADKLRQQLRTQGVPVPRKSRVIKRPGVGLTARQTEVLALLAEQLSNLDIADRLFLSPRTVEHHVAAVMSKLNATTRDQAVASAAEQGLLTIGQQLPTH